MTTIDRRIRALLDDLVVEQQLQPGDRLPTERELAEVLGVSRSAIRRALLRLQDQGLISRTVGRGTFLADPHVQRMTLPANTSPADILQARLTVEPAVAALAARSAHQIDLDHLAEHLAAESRINTFENTESADAEIHRAIASATHNDVVIAACGILHEMRGLPIWSNAKRRTSTPERRTSYHRGHVDIVTAIAERDPRAAEAAMTAHLLAITADLLGGSGYGSLAS